MTDHPYTIDSALQRECNALLKRDIRPQEVVNMSIALGLPIIVTMAFPRMPTDVMNKLVAGRARISCDNANHFSIKERIAPCTQN